VRDKNSNDDSEYDISTWSPRGHGGELPQSRDEVGKSLCQGGARARDSTSGGSSQNQGKVE
jgi:hypothetical protein